MEASGINPSSTQWRCVPIRIPTGRSTVRQRSAAIWNRAMQALVKDFVAQPIKLSSNSLTDYTIRGAEAMDVITATFKTIFTLQSSSLLWKALPTSTSCLKKLINQVRSSRNSYRHLQTNNLLHLVGHPVSLYNQRKLQERVWTAIATVSPTPLFISKFAASFKL